MKSLSLTALSIFMLTSLIAQVDRTKMPEPGPAPEIQLKDYDSFTLDNGLKVFVIEDKKIPRVAVNLIVDRDPILEKDKAGYVSFAGELLGEGTESRDKEALYDEIEFIGGRLSTSSNSVYVRSLSDHTEKVMEIMADVVKSPSFPESSFERIKKQALSALKAEENDPDAIAQRVMNAILYGKNHPYGEVQTRETIENITLEDCKNYYDTYFKPNISYMAIVGDISKRKAKKYAKKYFGDWVKGDVPSHKYETPAKPDGLHVAVVDRETAVQSVIRIGNTIQLKTGDEDVVRMSVMNQILGGGSQGRLFQNLREDKAYTYGAYSGYGTDKLISAFRAQADVRNEVTDSAVVEFLAEFNKISNEKVDQEELESAKNFRSGSFARSLESPQTIARYAINIDRYDLDNNYYKNYLQKIEGVQREDVQNVAQKYIDTDNPLILVVGKASEVAPKLEEFGEVHHYDIYGDETDGTQPEIPEGLTAKDVIKNYIESVGGKSNIDNINNITFVREAELQGQKVELTQIYAQPNKLKVSMVLKAMGMNIIESVFDGEKMNHSVQGNPQPVPEDELKDQKISSRVIPELEYLNNDQVEIELASAKRINGNAAYEIKVTYPSGNHISNYYDAESGLKVREVEFQETPDGGKQPQVTNFYDFKEINGVKFPGVTEIALGQGMTLEAVLKSHEVNTELGDDTFKTN